MVNDFEKILIPHLVSSALEKTIKYWPALDSDTTSLKCSILVPLIYNGVLDFPTQGNITNWIRDAELRDLHSMLLHGFWMVNTTRYEKAPTVVEQQCHAVTAYTWVLADHRETLKIMTGVTDKTHHHSWLYDTAEDLVLEPTPYGRDMYYGYIVENPLDFVRSEYDNILRLGEEGRLPSEGVNEFASRFQAMWTEAA